jgi:intein/homing endonuclease
MSWEQGIQKRRKTFPNINQEILAKEGYLEEYEAKILFYKFLRENPSFASELLTGIKLFPFQHMAIKAMMETDYFLGIWSRGLSKCLHYDSLVWTNRGLIKIGDIEIGDEVQSQNSFNKVLDKTINPSETTYKITTNSGFESEGLDYHRIMVLNKDLELEWKYNKEIVCGDYVVIKRGCDIDIKSRNIFDGFEFINDVENFNKPKLLIKNEKDIPDWYYFFGLLIGDGCILKTPMGVSITSKDQETKDFLESFSKKIGLHLSVSNKDGECQDLRIYSKELVSFLKFLGFNESKAHQKTIPETLTNNSKENIKNLLIGLFDTDGYCSSQRREKKGVNVKVGFTSTSETLLKQIQNLCLQFGIIFRKSVCFKGGASSFSNGKTYECKKAWSLISCNQKDIRIFKNQIGFKIKRKNTLLESLEDQLVQNESFCDYIPYVGEHLERHFGKKSIVDKKDSKYKLNFRKNTSKRLLGEILNTGRIQGELLEKLSHLIREDLSFEEVVATEIGEAVTVDIHVENEHCYVADGIINHNSFSTAVFAILDATLNQGVHIGLISKSFRQAKMIFNKMEEISLNPKSEFFAQAITRVSKSNDQWTMEIGRSKITALPLGDGEKLRGFRFQRMIIDELLLMPEKVLNEVIIPFLSVVENPTERQEIYDLETRLIAEGKLTEEDRKRWPNNKIIGLSSASYRFEYLFKMYSQYESLILNQNAQDGAHRTIMHLSYDCAPDQLYDQNLINQAKATMSEAQFSREFGAVFTDDSSGYFKVSKMMECTFPDGEGQCVEVIGDSKDEYILSIDPSWSESESSDDFAMVLSKRDPNKPKGTVVHGYAMSGTNLKSHIIYLAYLLNNFNIVSIVADYNGGVQFINSCNESEIFKQMGIKLEIIDADFDNMLEYEAEIKKARNQYDLKAKRIVYLRKPSSQWIRYANESLQSAFDHKNIFFAGAAMDDNYNMQRKAPIPIKDLKFLNNYDENQPDGAKMIDFVEHQKDMMDLIRVECALIQVTSSVQGTQSFDLPANLKKQRGADKARKDSYSALVLNNWMISIHFDMMNQKQENVQGTFIPFLI